MTRAPRVTLSPRSTGWPVSRAINACLPEEMPDGTLDVPIVRKANPLASNDHNVPPRRNQITIGSHRLAHEALDPVTPDGLANVLADRVANSHAGEAVGMDTQN